MTRRVAILGCLCAAVAVTSCHFRRPSLPSPTAAGLNTRDLIDPVAQAEADQASEMEHLLAYARRAGSRIQADLRATAVPGRPPRNVLCLSGGGSYGAYSAGVLVGWTWCGGRPTFDTVTGISIGALIAPFAFLGPAYDAELEHLFTTLESRDIYTRRYVRGALGGESFTDTAPLRKLICRVLTPRMVADLAAAHRRGRRLYAGTTEIEGKRFVVWDIGAIASRNGPGDRDLIIDVLVGSAAAPGFFPASKITVSVDGVAYAERHVDGGVSKALFFRPPYVPPEQRREQGLNLVDTNVWAIVAGKLYADAEVVRPRAVTQAAKSVSTIIYAQTRGDLQRLWTLCLLSGMNYRTSAIPQDFPAPTTSGRFDPPTLTALFEEGRRVALDGTAWRAQPPDVLPGEPPQERWGRDLTVQPRVP